MKKGDTMKLLNNKKGFAITELAPIAVAFVATAVTIGLGLSILGSMAQDQCGDGYSWNSTQSACVNATGDWAGGAGETYSSNISKYGMESGGELSSWLPTIALVIAAAIIIGVVVTYLARRV